MINLLYNKLLNLIDTGRTIFLCLLFFLTNICFPQDSIITVDNYRGSGHISCSYDGGYVLINARPGDSSPNRINKLDRQGNILWTQKPLVDKFLKFTDLDYLSNGDMILSCQTAKYWTPYYDIELAGGGEIDGALIRLNTCGEVEWITIAKIADVYGWDPLRKMDISVNDEIWVNQYCGLFPSQVDSVFGSNGVGQQFIMNKYDANGELLAQTDDLFIGSGQIRDVIALDDGGAIVCGAGNILPYYNQVYDPITNPTSTARSVVIKFDQNAEIEWYNIYRWEEDEEPDTSSTDYYAEFLKKIASRGSSMLETDSNTFIVSAIKYEIDTVLETYYYKHLLYELDENGQMIRDTLYNDTKSAHTSNMEYLNDTTIVLVQNPSPFDEWGGDPYFELEVQKIDARTWDILGEYSDTTLAFYPISEIAISKENKILIVTYRSDGIGTQIRVIDPVTMTLDTIPTSDTNSYDYLCGVPYITEDIELPPDTANYPPPIGLVEIDNMVIDVFIRNKTLVFNTNGYNGYNYVIYNSQGQSVFAGVTLTEENDISFLPAGVYFLEFMTKKNIEPVKFVLE